MTETSTPAQRAAPALGPAGLGLLGSVGALAVFEVVPRSGIVDRRYLPPASSMLAALGDLLSYVVTGFRLAAAVALILEVTAERVLVLSNRPTVVLADVRINLPDDRDQLGTRSAPEFGKLRGHVYELIQQAKQGHRPG